MSEVATKTLPVVPRKKAKKLKPARKQVKAGDVVKTEAVQTGKEYSAYKRSHNSSRNN
jgi:hypothetical protein